MLVAPLVTAMGALALTGTIGRVQRNEPLAISIALGLVLAAGTLWLLSGQLIKRTTVLRIASAAFALGGFVLGLAAAVWTANDEPRPQIKASLSDDAHKLTADITASNMETGDRLAIFVDALTRDPTAPGDYLTEPVYRGYEGPDGDGNVNITVSTFLPKGAFTDVGVKAFTDETSNACDDQLAEDAATEKSSTSQGKPQSGTGCVTLALIPK